MSKILQHEFGASMENNGKPYKTPPQTMTKGAIKGKGKFKAPNTGVASKVKMKSKRYPRSGSSLGASTSQYDFSRKNKPQN
jgi:hypothetical protein